MSGTKFSNTTPPAPIGRQLIQFQADGQGNISASIPTGGGGGGVSSVAMTGDGVIFNATVPGSPITTTGTLAPALLTQSANQILAGPTTGPAASPTFRLLVAADVPNLPASIITTGQLALARGGTNADLSATGGASKVLKQVSVGAAITVGQLAASDLSNGVTGSGAVVLATSPTLVTPTLGVASATSLNTALITTATTQLQLQETGDALGKINLYLRNRGGSNGAIFENPSVCLTDFGMQTSAIITNIAIDGSNNLTVTAVFASVASSLPAVGQKLTLSGLTTATFLNGQVVTVATISATQFTATFTHALYASAPDTGIAVAQNNIRAEFRNDKVLSTLNTSGEIQFFDPTNPGSGTWLASGTTGTVIGDSLSTTMVANFQRALMLISTNAVMNVTRISASMTAAAPAIELAHATSNVATPDYFWDIFGNNASSVETLSVRRRTPEFSHVGSDAVIAQFDQNGGLALPVALVSILGAGGLPTQTNQPLVIAGGFSSPVAAKIYVGDGTGWELDFATRTASTDTTLFKMKDSGVLDIATGITIAGAATTGNVLRGNGTNFVSAALIAADIPSLDASKITTGQLALAQGGTGADLSATGATSFVLTQFGLGAPVTVRQLASSNLSDGTVGSGAIVLASATAIKVASFQATLQTAAIASTLLYAVPSTGAGMYRVNLQALITRAATTSSTMGPLTISYTTPDNVAVTSVIAGQNAAGAAGTTVTGNSLNNPFQGVGVIMVKASTNINFTFGYISSGATTMQYRVNIWLEAIL